MIKVKPKVITQYRRVCLKPANQGMPVESVASFTWVQGQTFTARFNCYDRDNFQGFKQEDAQYLVDYWNHIQSDTYQYELIIPESN